MGDLDCVAYEDVEDDLWVRERKAAEKKGFGERGLGILAEAKVLISRNAPVEYNNCTQKSRSY